LQLEPEKSHESGKTDAGARRHGREKLRRTKSLVYVGEISEAAPALVPVNAAYTHGYESVRSYCSTHHNPEVGGPG
jgi:hypothetical protein